MPGLGKFIGTLKVEYKDDGKTVNLLEDITFVDSKDKSWTAEKGMPSDGASIPRVAWSIIGSPLQGPYVRPAVIHDQYCITRTEPYKSVHRMFYEAMLAAGVGQVKATTMYTAVLCGGPRWDEMTVEGARKAFDKKTKSALLKKPSHIKPRNPKIKAIKFGSPIDSISLYEKRRTAKAVTQIDLDEPITIYDSTEDDTTILDYISNTKSIKLNISQKPCNLTERDKNAIVEFANTNPTLDEIENFSDSLRLEKGIAPEITMFDFERHMRQQKNHVVKINEKHYLLRNTALNDKNIKRLIESKVSIKTANK